VTETDSGDRALARALEGTFSCLVLDVMLPGRDGFSVVSELRKRGVSTPVLLLTAKDELESACAGSKGAPMITSRSHSIYPSCWRACMR